MSRKFRDLTTGDKLWYKETGSGKLKAPEVLGEVISENPVLEENIYSIEYLRESDQKRCILYIDLDRLGTSKLIEYTGYITSDPEHVLWLLENYLKDKRHSQENSMKALKTYQDILKET